MSLMDVLKDALTVFVRRKAASPLRVRSSYTERNGGGWSRA